MSEHEPFQSGVIEGFYGPPWEQFERLELFDWMARWELNTYLYAPKDDLKQRVLWRELYSAPEQESFRALIAACKDRNIRFVYAISPGLDIRYSSESEIQLLQARFEQMLALGCEHFSLLFDDIPERTEQADIDRFGSLAAAQCHVANALFAWIRQRSRQGLLLFCPTAYCGRMARRKLGGEHYLTTIGRDLLPEIGVFWTGPEIISQHITVPHIQEAQSVLRRKPLIWDNLHANDYDGRRFYCGPYSGRPAELRQYVRGILSNPNTEFPLNYVPLRTLSDFLRSREPWNPRAAYLSAMREWHSRFGTVTQPVPLEDLVLFGDCYYLPHEEGPEAEALFQRAARMVTAPNGDSTQQTAELRQLISRLRRFCGSMCELRDRRLFYALSRRVWDLRERLELLDGYIEFRSRTPPADGEFASDSHLPGTYQGGIASRLERLLEPALLKTTTHCS